MVNLSGSLPYTGFVEALKTVPNLELNNVVLVSGKDAEQSPTTGPNNVT